MVKQEKGFPHILSVSLLVTSPGGSCFIFLKGGTHESPGCVSHGSLTPTNIPTQATKKILYFAGHLTFRSQPPPHHTPNTTTTNSAVALLWSGRCQLHCRLLHKSRHVTLPAIYLIKPHRGARPTQTTDSCRATD